MDFEVGKEVWFDDSLANNPKPRAVEITCVGRKWISAGKGWTALRFDPGTLRVDGGRHSSPGKIWPNREAAEAEFQRWRVWSALRNNMLFFGPPAGVTALDVARAAYILGLVPESLGVLTDALAKLEELAKR